MHLRNLVGRVAIRGQATANGNREFTINPVLVLSYVGTRCSVCVLEDGYEFTEGNTIILRNEFMDDCWQDFGEIMNSSVQTKSQVIRKMLTIMGVVADDESIRELCTAISIQELLDIVANQLGVVNMVKAVRLSNQAYFAQQSRNVAPHSPANPAPVSGAQAWSTPPSGSNTTWNNITQSPPPRINRGFYDRNF